MPGLHTTPSALLRVPVQLQLKTPDALLSPSSPAEVCLPAMQALYGQPVFEVDGETFYWEDVILAAMRSGGWAALERAAREGLAVAARLDRSDEPDPEEEIEEAANQFRYDRDLLRADDVEEWLAARGVTVEEWMDLIRREVLRQRAGDDVSAWMTPWEPEPDKLAGALRVDLLCGNAGVQLVHALAERAAGSAAARSGGANKMAGNRKSVAEGLILESSDPGQDAQTDATGGEALAGLDPERMGAVVDRLERTERGWARFERSLTGPEAIEREVGHRQLDWLRVSCQAIGFTDVSQAREAALCIREDGLSLDQVAADAHQEVVDLQFLLDELEAGVRPLFLAAPTADLVGPIAFEDRHTLFRVLAKAPPSPEDPDIRRRAAEALVARAVELELQHRVRWLIS